jgi:virginiamycin B lyase
LAGITELLVPGDFGSPFDITTGPDGALWFTQEKFGVDFISADHIGRITPAGSVTEFPIPGQGHIVGGPGGGGLHITAGPDGNLWFTELGQTKIARMTTSGNVTEFSIGGYPGAITVGPDGSLWFTDNVGSSSAPIGKIGRITLSGAVSEFAILSDNTTLSGITAGPDGNLWFTETTTGKIGRINPCVAAAIPCPSGSVSEFSLPTAGSSPGSIALGPDNNLWFTETVETDAHVQLAKIGRITTSGAVTEFSLPASEGSAFGITAGPDGNLWFTERSAGRIGRITPNGSVTGFSIPTQNSGPAGITAGPDGNLWFGEDAGLAHPMDNRIGKVVFISSGTADQHCVAQIYLDLLHRPVDPAGLATWTTVLGQGISRAQVALAIETSPEYRTVVVQDLYNQFLHRPADSTGLSFFTRLLADGATIEQVQTALSSSDEYFQTRGSATNEGFLDALYRDALNRNIDPTGQATFLQALAGGAPRSQVAAVIFASDEFRQDIVQGLYQRFLHRPADPQGLQAWNRLLRTGERDERVIASFVGSDEYGLRA